MNTTIDHSPLIVGIGGTARNGSSTERALRTCLAEANALGARTEIFSGEDMLLPMYQPGQSHREENAKRLIDMFRRADGFILASPAYHGSLSGLVKNVLDYTEDLRSDERVYFDGCAIGCICSAGGWQAATQTLGALRTIVHALRGWPTPLGAVLNTTLPIFDDKGAIIDEVITRQLKAVAAQVVEFSFAKAHVKAALLPRHSLAEEGVHM
jgi:FMN reductase